MHLLSGLRNWMTMYQTFLHEAVIQHKATAWAVIMKHLAMSFKPAGLVIKVWIEKFDTKVQDIIKAGVPPNLIDVIMLGSFLGKFRKFKELTVDSQRWINSGDALCPYTWVGLHAEIKVNIEKDALNH